MHRPHRSVLGGLAVLAVTLVAPWWPQPESAAAAPVAQSIKCSWTDLGNFNRSVFYPASAMDTEAGVMYVYGGTADPSANWETQSMLSSITFGTSLGRSNTRASNVAAAGSLDREALAGVFRPAGDDSAVYWIGGRNNSGTTSNLVQTFTIKTGAWGRLNSSGNFGNRNEHAAAYDPKHDAIWVAAGESTACSQVPCTAPTMPTNYLSFDASTGAATWNDGPSGGPRAKGGSMVYDSTRERMLFFGGTIDGNRGTDQLYALDLSDPDIAKAKWSQIQTTGTGPSVAVHGAAYNPDLDWMVVYGGMKANYAEAGRESAETRTFALDLAAQPPTWRNLGATVGDRIQTVMEYLPQHKAVIMTSGRDALNDPIQNNLTKRNINALTCEQGAAPTPSPDLPRPTPTSGGGGEPTNPPPPQPTLVNSPDVCDSITGKVPATVINAAVANPAGVSGYGMTCNPNLPPSAFNPLRHYLNLRQPSLPYHPLFNSVTWACGCR